MDDAQKMAELVTWSQCNYGAPYVIDNVDFWRVGSNATHQYYIAQVGFAFLVYCVGEGYKEEEDWSTPEDRCYKPYRKMESYNSFSEIEKIYLGHL